ncbi:hypothetical protein F2Q69_00034927 [Brassica cretica]|uniref:Uncharacterized protein n=1 Tax=Brassica cretica TaxID=69181 RepID=A0A8S9STV7_BRACR|nr:hypothetical protein F2Q69_00034927 [Brassica cretica]
MGVEKYSGLIAGQKFTGRTEIRPMDREARVGSLYGFRTWCQPSNNLSVYRSSRCRCAWKLYMQPDMSKHEVDRPSTSLTSGRSGGVLHVSWTCSQPCGARGAAVHASGAMRSDTRAATNLKLIERLRGQFSTDFESAPRDGSVQLNSSRPLSSFDDQLEILSGVSSVLWVQISRSSARYSAGKGSVQDKICPVHSSHVVNWVFAKSSPINQLLIGKEHCTGCKALCLDAAGRVSGGTGRGRGVNFVTLAGSSLTRHVALPDHGVGLDGQLCSCLIVGWPLGLSSPTHGVGRLLVMFLFDCWPVGRPMPRTVRGCYGRPAHSKSKGPATDKPVLMPTEASSVSPSGLASTSENYLRPRAPLNPEISTRARSVPGKFVLLQVRKRYRPKKNLGKKDYWSDVLSRGSLLRMSNPG